MRLHDARTVLLNPANPFVEIVHAAMVITSDPCATTDDLLRCLDFPGSPNEYAKIEIRRRLDGEAGPSKGERLG